MLSHVLAEVSVRLATAGVTAPLLVGRRNLPQSTVEPPGRIVVIPTNDSYGSGSTQTFNADGPRQRTLVTRMCGADVHVWGVPADNTAPTADADAMAAAEELLHAFIRELRHVCRGQWKVTSGRWNNEGGYDLIYGAEYVLQIAVDVPVTDLPRVPLPPGTRLSTAAKVGPSDTEVVE